MEESTQRRGHSGTKLAPKRAWATNQAKAASNLLSRQLIRLRKATSQAAALEKPAPWTQLATILGDTDGRSLSQCLTTMTLMSKASLQHRFSGKVNANPVSRSAVVQPDVGSCAAIIFREMLNPSPEPTAFDT